MSDDKCVCQNCGLIHEDQDITIGVKFSTVMGTKKEEHHWVCTRCENRHEWIKEVDN